MSPLQLLLLTLARAQLVASSATRFMYAGEEPYEGPNLEASLSEVGDKVENAVNDPLTKKRMQAYYNAMELGDAWSLQLAHPDRKEITVLIIDSGTFANHEDLSGRLAQDSMGRHGFNTYNMSDDIVDWIGHGTALAGIVAGQVNNSLGIAGVDPMARILIAKAVRETGGISSDAAVRAIQYGVENGAQVILMSFQTITETSALKRLEDAMLDAELTHNTFFVSAAGDDGEEETGFPCTYRAQNTLCVGATRSDKLELADFSNFGEEVDVAAPGADILSTTPKQNPDCTSCVGPYYGHATGTSNAAAIVAGVVSMLLSVGANPMLIADYIRYGAIGLQHSKHIRSGAVSAGGAMRLALGLPK